MLPTTVLRTACAALALATAACAPEPVRRPPPPPSAPDDSASDYSHLPAAPPAAATTPPVQPSAQSLPEAAPELGARAQAALAEARLRVAEAKAREPGFVGADGLLRLTAAAAARGEDSLTLHYARQTIRRADLALNDYYTALARAELDAIHAHTGLDDLQLSRLQYIGNAIARGDGRTAYELATGLGEELAIAARPYRVRAGETLGQIAARKDVYGNARLWPLIFDANRETLRAPSDLSGGKLLQIRSNPTIAEVVQAIERAGEYRPGEVFIGEIQVVDPR